MFTEYLNTQAYDIPNSYVIGDRVTDVQLAKNLGCKAIWLNNQPGLGGTEVKDTRKNWKKSWHWKHTTGRIFIISSNWDCEKLFMIEIQMKQKYILK